MGIFDVEKDDDKTIKYSLLTANIVKENNKCSVSLFCGQKDGKINDFTLDFKGYRELANYLWKQKIGWSHNSFVSYLDKDRNVCFTWNHYKSVQKTAQMVGRVSCNEVLHNIDALLISSNKYYDAVYSSLTEIDKKLLKQKQNVNRLKEENENCVILKEADNDFAISVSKDGKDKKIVSSNLFLTDKKEIEHMPAVCFLNEQGCEAYGKTTRELIDFIESRPLYKPHCVTLYSSLIFIVPNHSFLYEIKSEFECGQLFMKAYVSDNRDGEHLSMVCNQDGNISPAKIKIKDNTVTDIFFDGKFHKIKGIELDTETGQCGKLWKFTKSFKIDLNLIETVRVVDITHNMFEIVGGKGIAPSSVKDSTLEEIEFSVYTGDIPVIISDWGKRDFTVIGRAERQQSVLPKPKVRKLSKPKNTEKNSFLFDSDISSF